MNFNKNSYLLFVSILDDFSWHIIMRTKIPEHGACDPIAPLELPHAMHAFKRVSSSDSLNVVHFFSLMPGFYFNICLD